MSKEAAYYINNLIMMVSAFLLAYLTISSALPSWLPFGGEVLSAGTYNAIARPLGILYLLLLAVCPLLPWGKTERGKFLKKALIPSIAALVLFVVLLVYFASYLVPGYFEVLESGSTQALGIADEGPAWYYNGLAVVGFLVASLLFFNSLFMIVRGIGRYSKAQGKNMFVSTFQAFKNRASVYGGFLSHLAMAIILVGLIGSSMYVTEKVGYMGYDIETDTATSDFVIKDYTLKYKDNSVEMADNQRDIFYTVRFDVYKDGEFLETLAPSVQLVTTTTQQQLHAAVSSMPTEDLFVVYRGISQDGAFSLDVRVNPLISFVWVGFVLLIVGVLISTIGRRNTSSKSSQFEKAPDLVSDAG